MSGAEAFAFKALAEIAAAERAAKQRHRRAVDPPDEDEPRAMTALAAIITGLGERIAAFGRRLGQVDMPVGDSQGIVRPT